MKLKEATTKTIKEATIKANADLTLDGIVLEMLLNELETRMSEKDFIAFCDEL